MNKIFSALLVLVLLAMTNTQLTVRNNCTEIITVYSYTEDRATPSPYENGQLFDPQVEDVIEIGQYGIQIQLWTGEQEREDQTWAFLTLAHMKDAGDYACYGSRKLSHLPTEFEINPSDPSCDTAFGSAGEYGDVNFNFCGNLNFTLTFCPLTNTTMGADRHNGLPSQLGF